MEIFIKVSQLVLSLSILIVLHELGHFIPSKLFKTRVEKFYLFFNPWFSIFKINWKGTEYGLGWLPLGGYVKISGMIDESMDKKQLEKPPEPWEFRSKPAWQRLIIMVGGVTVNIILAIVIYIMILFVWGESYLSTKNVKYGIECMELGKEIGLQNGDKILTIDGRYIDNFNQIQTEIILNEIGSIQVDREGKKIDIPVPHDLVKKMIKAETRLWQPRMPMYVSGFIKDSPAKLAGMKEDDKIIGVNQQAIKFFDEFRAELQKSKNKLITVVVLRNGITKQFAITVPDDGLIGIALRPMDELFELSKKEYTLFAAVPAGFAKSYETLDNYLKQLKLIVSPENEAYKSLGGFITIGKIFPSQWQWQNFWNITAFLSIMLAILNILPIPALDGGHVAFLLYEIVAGRKPPDKFLEYAQIVGMILLFGLLILANGNDIIRLFSGK